MLGADSPDLVQWLVAGLLTPTAVVLLFLTKRIMLPSDCDQRVRQVLDQRDVEREAWDKGMAALEERNAALIADRDAWRAAHKEEAEARAAAERSAAKLMETSNLSVQLLEALQEAWRGREGR